MKKTIYILIVLMMLAMPLAVSASPNESGGTSVEVPNGPTFWVDKVVSQTSVRIGIKNHPKNEVYYVYMKSNNNPNTGWKNLGVLSNQDGSHLQTFTIPSILSTESQLSIMVLNNATGENATTTFTHTSAFKSLGTTYSYQAPNLNAYGGHSSAMHADGLTVWIHEINHPYTITLAYSGYMQKERYQIWITDPNNAGAEWKDVGNIRPENLQSGKITFTIPSVYRQSKELTVKVVNFISQEYVWIKFQNRTNWSAIGVYNSATDTYSASNATAYSSYSSGAASGPTPFTVITSVVENESVTLNAYNFKANDELLVTMGLSGTYGIGGISVAVQNTGESGNFTATYPIPTELKGQYTLSIRLESYNTKHYAFDWFNNDSGFGIPDTTGTTTVIPTTVSGTAIPTVVATPIPSSNVIIRPGIYPSFAIGSITPNTEIEIIPANFTGNDTYVVTMGPFGSYGKNGYVSTTLTTDANGTLSSTTLPIPAGVQGYSTIHVRLESPLSGFYAYNYFNQ